MARDTITVTSTVRAGVMPTVTVPNAGLGGEFANNGRTLIVFVSGLGGAAVGAGARTVLVQQVDDPYGRKENNAAFAITNDAVATFGPFPPALYNQTDGTVQLDYVALSTNPGIFALAVVGA